MNFDCCEVGLNDVDYVNASVNGCAKRQDVAMRMGKRTLKS